MMILPNIAGVIEAIFEAISATNWITYEVIMFENILRIAYTSATYFRTFVRIKAIFTIAILLHIFTSFMSPAITAKPRRVDQLEFHRKHHTGLEPATDAWKAPMLPLHQWCKNKTL